jgi:hypothetical protein
MMPRLTLAALACALVACLATPAAARADDYVSGFTLTPRDTAAGVHTQVDMHANFDSADPVRDLHIHLAPGLLGNPSAVPVCEPADFQSDSCDPATRVGSTSVDTITTIAFVPTPVTATGYVYNVRPGPNEPARLGVIVQSTLPVVGSLAKIVLPVTVSLRPDGGLDTNITDIPSSVHAAAVDLPTTVTAMDLHLGDASSAGAASFMTTPTSCGPAQTTLEAVTRSNVTHSAAASFTPTDCAGLAFTPRLAATLEARGPKGASHRPTFTTILTVPPGQAATSSTHVKLPSRFSLETTAIKAVCSLAQQAADQCPDGSRVGSVRAQTPLLPVPLSGAVYLAQQPGQLLPGLRLALGGPVELRLGGGLNLTQPLVATFDGIPDVPLSRLELTFAGGGPLKVLGDPCTGGVLRTTGELKGHNGKTATAPARVRMLGCPIRVTAHPNTIDIHKGRDAYRLKQVRIRLGKRAIPRSVTADGHRVRAVHTKGRWITVKLHKATHVVVRFRRGTLHGPLLISGTRTGGKHSAVRLKAARLR